MTAKSVPTPAPDLAALTRRVQDSFERQGMMVHLGAKLLRVEPGLCEVALPHSEKVTQQQGGFHGGAMGALADIAGGYAALTVAPDCMGDTSNPKHPYNSVITYDVYVNVKPRPHPT